MTIIKYILMIVGIFLLLWLGCMFILKSQEKKKSIIKSNQEVKDQIKQTNEDLDEVIEQLEGLNPMLEKAMHYVNEFNDKVLSKK